MKFLFVCSSNLDRSPAAEELFNESSEHEAKSCGILPHAETVISKEAVVWADIVFCMEDKHKRFIIENFREDVERTRADEIMNKLMEDKDVLELIKKKLS